MRSKLVLILGIALVSAGALFAASQSWVTFELVPGSAAFSSLAVTGQQLNASLTAIALAGFAAALALTIAGSGFRRVLGTLVVLFGAGTAAVAISVLTDPWGAATGRLAEATGIAGQSQLDMVERSAISPFIALAIACGVLLALLGVLVLMFGGSWKKSAGRKYAARDERSRTQAAESTREGEGEDRFADWDSLSEGEDPTEGEPTVSDQLS